MSSLPYFVEKQRQIPVNGYSRFHLPPLDLDSSGKEKKKHRSHGKRKIKQVFFPLKIQYTKEKLLNLRPEKTMTLSNELKEKMKKMGILKETEKYIHPGRKKMVKVSYSTFRIPKPPSTIKKNDTIFLPKI